MARKKKDYEVGYAKPPKSGRFKKGQSGNPKGRPKKKGPGASELIREFAEEIITVKRNGQVEDVTRFNVLLHQLWTQAIKGDTGAMRLISQMVQAAERLRPPPEKTECDKQHGGVLAIPMFHGTMEDWAALPNEQVVPEVIGKGE